MCHLHQLQVLKYLCVAFCSESFHAIVQIVVALSCSAARSKIRVQYLQRTNLSSCVLTPTKSHNCASCRPHLPYGAICVWIPPLTPSTALLFNKIKTRRHRMR